MSRKQSAVDHVNSIPSHLHHPLLGGVLSDTGERHTACLQVQEEEYVISCQSAPGEHFDGEEIDPSQNRHVSANELCPVHLLTALRSRSDTKSAGLNRHVVGDERALQERRTANPSWPRVLQGSSRGGD